MKYTETATGEAQGINATSSLPNFRPDVESVWHPLHSPLSCWAYICRLACMGLVVACRLALMPASILWAMSSSLCVMLLS